MLTFASITALFHARPSGAHLRQPRRKLRHANPSLQGRPSSAGDRPLLQLGRSRVPRPSDCWLWQVSAALVQVPRPLTHRASSPIRPPTLVRRLVFGLGNGGRGRPARLHHVRWPASWPTVVWLYRPLPGLGVGPHGFIWHESPLVLSAIRRCGQSPVLVAGECRPGWGWPAIPARRILRS